MIERRTAAKLIRFRPDNARDTLPVPSASGDAAEIEPLMTAADVGHVLHCRKSESTRSWAIWRYRSLPTPCAGARATFWP